MKSIKFSLHRCEPEIQMVNVDQPSNIIGEGDYKHKYGMLYFSEIQ